MPSTAPETSGFGQPFQCTISLADRRYDRHASQGVRVPDLVAHILPDTAFGPASGQFFSRADAKASVADRTELSGAVFWKKITPSEFGGVIAAELTGFACGIRRGRSRARADVGAGYGSALVGGAE